MPFKICVIGCGWMAGAGHGPAYQKYVNEHPETELTACCDIDGGRAEAFKNDFGFQRFYTDWEAMLAAEKPDAVCLLVNVEYISPISIKIFEMGIPLFLEKPPGINEAEAVRMAEAAARHNVLHSVAFNRRSTPVILKVAQAVKNLPSVQRFSYELLRAGRYDRDFSTTAIHGIDALRHISGADYKHIDFTYQELPELGEGVCNAVLECSLTNGATANLVFAPVNGILREGGYVIADGHYIEFSLPIPQPKDVFLKHYKDNSLINTPSDCPIEEEMYMAQGFYEENRSFFDDVRAERKPLHSIEETLQSVIVAECIRNRKKVYAV